MKTTIVKCDNCGAEMDESQDAIQHCFNGSDGDSTVYSFIVTSNGGEELDICNGCQHNAIASLDMRDKVAMISKSDYQALRKENSVLTRDLKEMASLKSDHSELNDKYYALSNDYAILSEKYEENQYECRKLKEILDEADRSL